jgi:hypothetical protein
MNAIANAVTEPRAVATGTLRAASFRNSESEIVRPKPKTSIQQFLV